MTQPTIPQLETWLSPGAGLPPAFGHAPEPVGQRGSRSCLPDAPVRSTSQYLLPAHEGGPPNPFARTAHRLSSSRPPKRHSFPDVCVQLWGLRICATSTPRRTLTVPLFLLPRPASRTFAASA